MSGQLTLPKPRPRGHIVAAYGGGVNTIAMLVQMRREGMRPTAIVMADPGDEWPETIAYRDGVANPWLASIGWPTVTVVTRASEAQYRPRAHLTPQGTLREECERIASLPSIAYGFKKCSLKFKRDPANWWLARQPWALDVWARGEKITRAIGYDADEDYRVRDEFGEPWEAARLTPLYPLFTAGIDRDGCVAMIRDRYADAVAMSRNARITSPDVVGLMRCLPEGKRQLHLHVWNDDSSASCGYSPVVIDCECAL
jgi:hypothetical protein